MSFQTHSTRHMEGMVLPKSVMAEYIHLEYIHLTEYCKLYVQSNLSSNKARKITVML